MTNDFEYIEFFKQLQRQSDEALLKALRRVIDDWLKQAEGGTQMWDYLIDEALGVLYFISDYIEEDDEKDD